MRSGWKDREKEYGGKGERRNSHFLLSPVHASVSASAEFSGGGLRDTQQRQRQEDSARFSGA